MLYCERCSALYPEGERCPLCRHRLGREVRPDDLCFLQEEGFVWSQILADLLQQAGIPFLQKQAVGVTPYIGVNLARYRFYVPYLRLEEAREVAKAVSEPAGQPEDETDAQAEEETPDSDL